MIDFYLQCHACENILLENDTYLLLSHFYLQERIK